MEPGSTPQPLTLKAISIVKDHWHNSVELRLQVTKNLNASTATLRYR